MRIVAPILTNPASKAKFAENKPFFAWQFYTLYKKKRTLDRLYYGVRKHNLVILVVKPPDPSCITSWSLQNLPKNKLFLSCDYTPFIIKSFQMWHHFLPLLFPKDSKSLKNLDIRLWERGAKKALKPYLKSEHTDKHVDKSTYREHQPRGSMLW